MIGTRLGRNRIVEKIGEGGMGAVYRGYDEHLDRDVAVKVLHPDALGNEAARKRFRREALALSKLNHPNIEIIYDFDTQDGVDYLVMEYVPGLTFREMLARGPLTEKEISRLGTQMAEGLAAAHEQGIVHCDLKPGNLMVAPDGRLKILDFGLAKLTRPAESTRTMGSSTYSRAGGGTLPYMAPEQLTGEPVDARTDIYAFGNILYEAATGRLPFQDTLSTALANEIVHRPPPPPGRFRPELCSRLEETILKCLEKNPENRYQSARELVVDLRRSSTTDADQVIPEPVRKRSRTAWLLAALLLIAVATTFAIAWIWLPRTTRGKLPGYQPYQITSTPHWEGEPVLSPDGSRIAYASDEAGNLDIYVTDIRGSAHSRLTDDPADDMEPAWFPDGSAIAFTSGRGGRRAIWKVGPLGGGATLLLEDAEASSISPDQRRIAFARALPDGTRRIGAASLDNPADARLLPGGEDGGADASDPAWSPDSRTVCYVDRRELWMAEASGGRAQRITSDGEDKSEPVWSPDGRYIYFSSYRGSSQALWRIPAGGGPAERVTQGIGPECHPSISKDRRLLIHATQNISRQLVLVDRESNEEKVLPGLAWFMPSIAPDGRRIVSFSMRPGSDMNLWVQNLDRGNPSGAPYRLTELDGVTSHPAFSPDGLWIAYYRILLNKRDIWILPASGGRPAQFTQDSMSNRHPAWSPDGSTIAYASERSGASQIWVAPVKDGRPAGTARQLTSGELTAYAPVWSPDGKTVAFQGVKREKSEVWLVPGYGGVPPHPLTDGANVKRLRWDRNTGDLFVSGSWDGDRVALRRVAPTNGVSAPYLPAVEFGGKKSNGFFDITPDGRWLIYCREDVSGDIWLLKASSSYF